MDREHSFGVSFERDTEHDVVFIYPRGTLDSIEAVRAFGVQLVSYYASVGYRFDLVCHLEGWSVLPAMAEHYDRLSASLVARFLRHVVIVDAKPTLLTQVTKARISGGTIMFAPTLDAAVALIQKKRAKSA